MVTHSYLIRVLQNHWQHLSLKKCEREQSVGRTLDSSGALLNVIMLGSLSYTALPRKGSPEARANVELFLAWSRTLGLSEPDIFEPDDLIKVFPQSNLAISHNNVP